MEGDHATNSEQDQRYLNGATLCSKRKVIRNVKSGGGVEIQSCQGEKQTSGTRQNYGKTGLILEQWAM